jgi:hypothetical protein
MVEMKHNWPDTLFITLQTGGNTAPSKQRQSDVVWDWIFSKCRKKAARDRNG